MTPDPLTFMDALFPIEFTDALVHLQALIGKEVKVVINHYGRFFGCGMEGTLDCVQTLPPDNKAVRIVLDGGPGFFLEPADLEAFIGGNAVKESTWLELHLSFGAVVTVEAARGETTAS